VLETFFLCLLVAAFALLAWFAFYLAYRLYQGQH
jgi:cell division protein FtsL